MILCACQRKVLEADVQVSFGKRETTLYMGVAASIFIRRGSFCIQDVVGAIRRGQSGPGPHSLSDVR